MLTIIVTVKTALLPSVTLPALLIEKLGGVTVALGRMVAVGVEMMLLPEVEGAFSRTTLNVSAFSGRFGDSTRVGMRICCVADPLGLNVKIGRASCRERV